MKNHQVVHDLAARRLGVDRVEVSNEMTRLTGQANTVEQARGALSKAVQCGVVHAAKVRGVLTRYFTRATNAEIYLQRNGAEVPVPLAKAAAAERREELEHAVRMGADPEILVAQRRSINRAQRAAPDRPPAPRAGQDDWRRFPSLIGSRRVPRGQQGGAA